MARTTGSALYFFVFIVFYAQNAIRVVECQNKRIIIHVPRRVQMVHHHHHHIVFMDPENDAMMVARPFANKPSLQSAEGYVQQEMRALGHEYEEQHEHQLHKRHRHRQQQQQHQEQTDGSHPLSYVEQRKTVAAAAAAVAASRHVHKHSDPPPYAFVPAALQHGGGSAWRPIAPPVVRDKRSGPWVIARRVTTTYGR